MEYSRAAQLQAIEALPCLICQSIPSTPMKPPEEFNDVIELYKRYHVFWIVLDEGLFALEAPLEEQGFRVRLPLRTEEIKDEARGIAVLTRNPEALLYDALRLDYDVISVEDLNLTEEGPEGVKEAAEWRHSRAGAPLDN